MQAVHCRRAAIRSKESVNGLLIRSNTVDTSRAPWEHGAFFYGAPGRALASPPRPFETQSRSLRRLRTSSNDNSRIRYWAIPRGAVPQTTAGATPAYPQQSAILAAGDSATPPGQGTVCTAANGGLPTYTYTIGALSNSQQPDWEITDLEVQFLQGRARRHSGRVLHGLEPALRRQWRPAARRRHHSDRSQCGIVRQIRGQSIFPGISWPRLQRVGARKRALRLLGCAGAIKGNYDFFYQPNFNYRPSFCNGGSNNAALARAFLATFQSSTFPGVASGLQFPLAAPGTLADSDRNTAVAKGMTLDSRNGTSTAILQPALNASGALPTGTDPL